MSSAYDPNTPRWYRHKVSGAVGVYPPALGENDPNLVEVPPGAKPLAYTPIPREAVEALRTKRKAKSGDAPRDDKEEE